MKNYLIILFIACSTFVSAQSSLELFHDGLLVTDTIEVYVSPNIEAKCYIDIANVSNNSIGIIWNAELAAIQGSYVSFCFETCIDFENGHNAGPQEPYYLHAGDTLNKARDGGAYITYNADGNIGTTYLKFTFSVDGEESDNATVIFKFISEDVGICNPNRQTVQTFEAYPNPAKSALYIQYDLSDKSMKDVQLVLHSLTGSVIKTIPVDASDNTVRVDVEDLAQGVYFCSLKVDRVISSSKKIVITK